MFYTKKYFWIELFLKFTLKKQFPLKREVLSFCDRWDSAYTTLLIHSYGIRKQRFSVAQLCLWLKCNASIQLCTVICY